MTTLAQQIRARFVEMNETVQSLADRTGLSEATLNRVLDMHDECPEALRLQVANAIGLHPTLVDARTLALLEVPSSTTYNVPSIVDVALLALRRRLGSQATDQREPYVPVSKPRSADVVLYLDLDGVVQHESVLFHPKRGIYMSPVLAPGRVLFEWVHYLEAALEGFPTVALVLSSSWCVHPGYSKSLKRLPSSLRGRFIGGTYHSRVHGVDPWTLADFRQMSRGMQIWADVQRRMPRQWLALDDDPVGWPDWARDNLVECDGSAGLSSERVRRELQAKLNRCFEALRGGNTSDPRPGS